MERSPYQETDSSSAALRNSPFMEQQVLLLCPQDLSPGPCSVHN